MPPRRELRSLTRMMRLPTVRLTRSLRTLARLPSLRSRRLRKPRSSQHLYRSREKRDAARTAPLEPQHVHDSHNIQTTALLLSTHHISVFLLLHGVLSTRKFHLLLPSSTLLAYAWDTKAVAQLCTNTKAKIIKFHLGSVDLGWEAKTKRSRIGIYSEQKLKIAKS